MQGCPMRCLYCHNPDTWKTNGGEETSVDEIISDYMKNRYFYSKGGITVTGGEPMLQIDFLIELFREARALGIHTAIDTSGITYTETDERIPELLSYTNLVMLDIKHIDNEKHMALTGHHNDRILAFAKRLEEMKIPLWVRHVVVEGYTDCQDDLYRLGRFIGGLKNLVALDVLPYHSMGKEKYKKLKIPYPLENIPDTGRESTEIAKEHILRGIRDERNKHKNTDKNHIED